LGLKVLSIERAFAFTRDLVKPRIDLLNNITSTLNFLKAMLILENTPFSHLEVNIIILELLNK
jgi:hypothetical protein